MGDQFFRFLDLPAELRLTVYNFLPITTRYHTLKDQLFGQRVRNDTPPSTFTLVAKTAVVAPLSTCCQIHQEYKPTIAKTLASLRSEPLRFMVDSPSLTVFLNDRECLASQIQALRGNILDGVKPSILSCTPHLLHFREPEAVLTDPAVVHASIKRCVIYAAGRAPSPTMVVVREHPCGDDAEYLFGVAWCCAVGVARKCGLLPMIMLVHEVSVEDEVKRGSVVAQDISSRIRRAKVRPVPLAFEVDDTTEENWDREWE